MGARELARRCAGTALVLALIAPGAAARAQEQPKPLPSASPSARAQANSAIVKPLSEIGRVRARTPYCAALARTRPAIDSAIAYEFTLQTVGDDLRHVRVSSYMAKMQSLGRLQRDLNKLWDEAKAGRSEVVALRNDANADGVDPQRRKELLAFANALDGAKARQMMLAKKIARVLGTMGEVKVDGIEDDPAAITRDPPGGASAFALDTKLADGVLLEGLFTSFRDEEFVRGDLKQAAVHGDLAVELGGCREI